MVDEEYIEHLAEAHWKYTKDVIAKSKMIPEEDVTDLDLMHYLYVEAFKHGYKHCESDMIEV